MAQNVRQNRLGADISYAQNTLVPAARTATVNGAGVDTYGFRSVEVVVVVGAVTDGTHALSLQESVDNATWTNVAATDIDTQFPPNLTTLTNFKTAYTGTKRYVRVVATVTGATTGGVYGAVVALGRPRTEPVVGV